MTKIVGLRELRENTGKYISLVKKGESFTIVRQSQPIFHLSSPEENEDMWERVVDFTKFKKGGILATELIEEING